MTGMGIHFENLYLNPWYMYKGFHCHTRKKT